MTFTIKTVYVEITNQCNLNCRTCYNRSGLNIRSTEMNVAQIRHLIELFTGYGMERFLISGGEPALHSHLKEILRLFGDFPNIDFGIVTNGTVQSAELVDYFNVNGPILQVSLDGSCEEENAKTRGVGHFHQTMKFLESLDKSKRKPLLKMVVSRNNFHDLENYYKMAISKGCVPEFAFVYKSGNGAENWDNMALTPIEKFKTVKLIESLNIAFETEAFLPLCTGRCPFAGHLNNLSICIKTDGSIQPCQSLYHENFALGNAFHFVSEAFAEELERIAGIAKKRSVTDFNCEKCLLKSGCGRGCMAAAFNLNGSLLAEDGNCTFRKLEFVGRQLKNGGSA